MFCSRFIPYGLVLLLGGLLSACVPQLGDGRMGHPNLIIVRQFGFSNGVVTLDPSFGFSLQRGEAGVPPRERAASVGRAATFTVGDTIAQQLAAQGYDVARSDTAQAEPGGRAIIVSGRFRHINEGHRRRVGDENASVAVEVEINQQSAGSQPQRIAGFSLDSRQAARTAVVGASAPRGANLNAAATRLGAAIAGMVGETARLNHWPAAPR